jgi:hypothetical protein
MTQHMVAFHLMYIDLADNEAMKPKLKELGLDHYIRDISPRHKEYVHLLPKVVYTVQTYDKSDFNILGYFGIVFDKVFGIETIHKAIVDYISKTQHKV